MIIRRRIRNWKTTICGIALLITPILIALFPKHALVIISVSSALTGSGFIAAADASAIPGQVGNPITEKLAKIFK